jgi:membrane peptidoglycan carboxypeptidase
MPFSLNRHRSIPGYQPLRLRGRPTLRLVRRFLILSLLFIAAFGAVGGGVLYSYAGELPSLAHLNPAALAQSTRIYARDGTTLLDERFTERRTVVPLTAISWNLRHATVAIEDKDFYHQGAINPLRMVAAAGYDILHRRAAQGASTITEQVIKNALFASTIGSRSLDVKVRELLLAIQLEQRYSKDQILGLYLNTILYGNQAYGAESAAQTYFNRSAATLDLAQAAFLAGLPQAPSYYNPLRPDGFAHARVRQQAVLTAMLREGYITAAQARAAYAEDLQPALRAAQAQGVSARDGFAPHFVDYVWDLLEQRYDSGFLLRGGLKVVTTLDPRTQTLAQQAVHDGVQRFSRSNGVNNAAMLVLNPHTGEVLGMVGSADYFNTNIGGQINYTTASSLQPGSSFKPYTYVTALMNGWTPASPLMDKDGAHAFPGYPVHDWDGRELGVISLRSSLQLSRNISSVHLFKDVGMDKVFATARKLGITTPLDPSLPTTLGASPVSMMEHLAAYSAFANGGLRVRPFAILSVTGPDGTVLERNDPRPDSGERVLPASMAYVLTDILKGAVHPVMSIPVAAKSGTTNDFKDAWYVGYSTNLAVAAWMGRTVMKPHPAKESMNYLWGETGPGAVWHAFMTAYYRARPAPADWTRPADVVSMSFCKATGQPATGATPDETVSDIYVKAAALAQATAVPSAGASANPLPDSCASASSAAGDGGVSANPPPSPSPSASATATPILPSIVPLPSGGATPTPSASPISPSPLLTSG